MAKTIIIGGVAGGATAATRLRRLDEQMEIVLLERGDYISYANCGLPYYIGDVIKDRENLLLQTPENMKAKFNIDVRIRSEVTAINRDGKFVTIRKSDGSVYDESYDELVIATGSSPLRPPIPGIDSEGIYTLWTVNDTDRIRKIVDEKEIKSAAVIGGGFIGLEMAENLHARGLHVSIIEAMNQVMAPIDWEMAQLLHRNIRANGAALYLGDGVKSFSANDGAVTITLASGKEITADMVILSIGVRANSLLAKEADLPVNSRGGIIVSDSMQTEDEHIWAVGDAVEITRFGSDEKAMIALAGPANKQGRIVAGNIAARYNPGMENLAGTYKGTQGTSVAKVFDMTAASVGLNEKTLIASGKIKSKDYITEIITQKSHAGYYPMATDIYIKLIFEPDGKILGAQIVGPDGVDKRIDTISVAIRLGATAEQLMDLEMAYAPPYSSAKDPVNMAGFVAENIMKGLMKLRNPMELDALRKEGKVNILDIRENLEVQSWAMDGARHIPLGELRARIEELSDWKAEEKEICILCGGGVRSWNAARALAGNGFADVSVLEGGIGFYRAVTEESENPTFEEITKGEDMGDKGHNSGNADRCKSEKGIAGGKGHNSGNADEEFSICEDTDTVMDGNKAINLDCCGMQCPGPIMKVSKKLSEMSDGEVLCVSATDMGFAKDIENWCHRTGNTFLSSKKDGVQYISTIRKGAKKEEAANGAATADIPHGKTMVVFDGDFDKALTSFIIANGAAAMGRPVTMFFTFWGLNILRKNRKVKVSKSAVEKLFGMMMPRGTAKLALSKLNMGGLGTKMMKMIMKQKNVLSLDELIQSALDNGVKIVACTMSMDVMGIKKEELIDGIEYAGVASYLGDAEMADVNLFI
ncbi:MAG: FAD-dependent oxidoreductase [Lachnospiraceae bacterium]|nr:FAD-dependent oxidoreductase [Lachnospiraceae bacterium]